MAHHAGTHMTVAHGFAQSLASPHAAALWAKQYARQTLTGAAKEAAMEQMIAGLPEGPAKTVVRASIMSGGSLSMWDMVDVINESFPDQGMTVGDDDVERLMEERWDVKWSKFASNMWDTGYNAEGGPTNETVFINRTGIPVKIQVCNMGKLFFMSAPGAEIIKWTVVPDGHCIRAQSDREELYVRVVLPQGAREQYNLGERGYSGWSSDDIPPHIPVGSTVTIKLVEDPSCNAKQFDVSFEPPKGGEGKADAASDGGGGGGGGGGWGLW
jgi:hypothetical protein